MYCWVTQVPATINRYLREYQRAGAQFMYEAYKHDRGMVCGIYHMFHRSLPYLRAFSYVYDIAFHALSSCASLAVSPWQWPVSTQILADDMGLGKTVQVRGYTEARQVWGIVKVRLSLAISRLWNQTV